MECYCLICRYDDFCFRLIAFKALGFKEEKSIKLAYGGY